MSCNFRVRFTERSFPLNWTKEDSQPVVALLAGIARYIRYVCSVALGAEESDLHEAARS